MAAILFYLFFYLQVTPKLPTPVRVNGPFGSGEEAKNRFLKWPRDADFLDFQ